MDAVFAEILILGVGIALLIVGGDLLVRGAVALAARLGVAPLVIGLTVVAFGTSAPELALNVAAALKDNSGLSFGNIVGSNIANIGLIIGLAALIRPLKVNADVVKRELPIMVGVTAVASFLALYGLREGKISWTAGFSRIDGFVMLAGFALVMLYTVYTTRINKREAQRLEEGLKDEISDADVKRPMWIASLLVLAGLTLLVLGGKLSESGASAIARGLGLSDEVIGLTIVALATSLPELATSVIAARRGQVDIAVGNIVGSNVFNLLLIMGVTSVISPVSLPSVPAHAPFVSIGMMLLLSLLLLPMSRTFGSVVSRLEGCLLLLLYAGYMAYEASVALLMRHAAGG